ncbi:MAG: AtpZ/AtpI family protein [Bacteroidota bacterium]
MADKPDNSLMQYAGFAAQLAVALVLAVYAGMWLDKHTGIHFPILIWLLPLVLLIGMLVKVVKDTTKK